MRLFLKVDIRNIKRLEVEKPSIQYFLYGRFIRYYVNTMIERG